MRRAIHGAERRQTGKGLALWRGAAAREEGSSLVEVALIVPMFLLLLVGAVDGGRGCYAAIEVTSAAAAGASYGVQVPTDTAGMMAAAALGAPDVNNLKTVAVTGCECSDGTSVSVNCASVPTNCSADVVTYVAVTTTATYTPLLKYPGIPSSFALSGTSWMRVGY